jgi:tetratricopeptide (TPR) repeat protein
MNTPLIAQSSEEGREAGLDDINRLTDELGKRDCPWVIFDNLETALNNRNFHDPGIDSLFTSLRDSTHQAKIIITSRTLPVLTDGGSLIDILEDRKHELKGLKANFAVDYLVKNGLDEVEQSQLEELALSIDGHPLALKLLIGLVKKFGVKDTLDDLSTFKRHKESTIKIARRLFDKLAGDEKELLEHISVFRQPEPIKAIENMFNATTSDDAIEDLIDKSLLETDHDGSYWLHPLVREFAYDDLEDKTDVHEIAMQYYLSIPLPEECTNKEDIQPLLEAHYHACRAEDYNKAFNIIIHDNLYRDLDRWGNYRTLIDLYLDLLPKDHFNDTSLLDNPQSHSAVLGNLGTAYLNMGQVEKAIEYHEQALVIAKEIGDRRGEGNAFGNLGNAYSILGQVEKAIEYHKQALVIAKEIGDRRNEGIWLGNLGSAYSNLGQVEKAIEYYEQALVIGKEIKDPRLINFCEENLKSIKS